MSFSGALAVLSANFNVPHNQTSPYARAPFNTAIYDHGGWLDAARGRMVVPPGVTMVRVTASLVWQYSTSGIRQLVVLRNGAFANSTGIPPVNTMPIDGTTTDHVAPSHPIPVSPGDYFEVHPYHTAGVTLPVLKSTGTCFSIEAVA